MCFNSKWTWDPQLAVFQWWQASLAELREAKKPLEHTVQQASPLTLQSSTCKVKEGGTRFDRAGSPESFKVSARVDRGSCLGDSIGSLRAQSGGEQEEALA